MDYYVPLAATQPFEVLCQATFVPISQNYMQRFAGDTVDINIPNSGWLNIAGNVDLSRATAVLSIAAAPGATPIVTETIAPPLPSYFRLSDAQTTTLGAGTSYYEIEYDNADSTTSTVQTGYLTLKPDTA